MFRRLLFVLALVLGLSAKGHAPSPGELHVVATADDALTSGVDTADGWHVTFDRFLVSLGHASVEGDACIGYSDPTYNRVLDMARGGPQDVNLVFAYGQCDFDFELSSPWEDSVLGAGVTAADRTAMRTPGSDPYVTDAGISIAVEGRARRDQVEKTFAWSYRRRIDYSTCQVTIDGKKVVGVSVAREQTTTVDLDVNGAVLFADHLAADEASFRFDAFAAGDTNDDGIVTLDELAGVALASVGTAGAYSDAKPQWATLADYLYDGLFAKVVRYRGNGTCETEIFANDRTPH